MKATVELISKLVESVYAGAAQGVALDTVKSDVIGAVFSGTMPSGRTATRVVKAAKPDVRAALLHATDAELAELEQKLSAAENAAHKNGEVTAVEIAVEQLSQRIKF